MLSRYGHSTEMPLPIIEYAMKSIFTATFLTISLWAQGQPVSARLPSDFGDGLALVPVDVESFAAISQPFKMPRFIGQHDSFFSAPLTPSPVPVDVFAQTMISFALTSDPDAEVFDNFSDAQAS